MSAIRHRRAALLYSVDCMFPYAEEEFTEDEEDLLSAYFTNTTGPVFALVNLDEVVKGALFARYSRSAKSLRRLFLDEFASDVIGHKKKGFAGEGTGGGIGEARARRLYGTVFSEYGDDSVAQLGGLHLACEQASNLLTKILERSRLMSYLEQSTRYIAYDVRLPNGRYRYYRDPEVLDSQLGAVYVASMDAMFDAYRDAVPKLEGFLARAHPKKADEPDIAHRRAVRARALDLARGLLPTASLSNVGIYGSGQAIERLVLRLRSSLLPEARGYAEMVLEEARKVIPSFLDRVDRADRGLAWQQYLEDKRNRMHDIVAAISDGDGGQSDARSSDGRSGDVLADERAVVGLGSYDPLGEDRVLAAALFEFSDRSISDCAERVERMSYEERGALLAAYLGERGNRRHRPGRALEVTAYTFEIVSDYGAFRDLQRHRMLTVDWQRFTPELGFTIPPELVEAGVDATYRATLSQSQELYEAMVGRFPEQAPYVLGLAHRIRYAMTMNAREAMHVIELRTSPQGHEVYRQIAQEMHCLIRDKAGHANIAGCFTFADHSGESLGRRVAESLAAVRTIGESGTNAAARTPEGGGAVVVSK